MQCGLWNCVQNCTYINIVERAKVKNNSGGLKYCGPTDCVDALTAVKIMTGMQTTALINSYLVGQGISKNYLTVA